MIINHGHVGDREGLVLGAIRVQYFKGIVHLQSFLCSIGELGVH